MNKSEYCPFCGSYNTSIVEMKGNKTKYYVKCHNCKAHSGFYNNPDDAIHMWNQRRPPGYNRKWEDICYKCEEGEIEPYFCPYYGEPCGCNAPKGIHPDAKALENRINVDK